MSYTFFWILERISASLSPVLTLPYDSVSKQSPVVEMNSLCCSTDIVALLQWHSSRPMSVSVLHMSVWYYTQWVCWKVSPPVVDSDKSWLATAQNLVSCVPCWLLCTVTTYDSYLQRPEHTRHCPVLYYTTCICRKLSPPVADPDKSLLATEQTPVFLCVVLTFVHCQCH